MHTWVSPKALTESPGRGVGAEGGGAAFWMEVRVGTQAVLFRGDLDI